MKEKVIVTGGGGFVGKALCLALKDKYQVFAISRNHYPELEEQGIVSLRADISDYKALLNLSEQLNSSTTIFHTAAHVKMWGKYKDFYRTNVIGTKNLLMLAQSLKTHKFIYTSSPSVIADGSNLKGVNESYPYPKKFKAFYPKTKSIAEQMVLKANSLEVKTLALRPHLIWGQGDTNLIPTILEKARSGKLAIIGDGNNLVDLSYIEDCVAAHLNAMEALDNNPKSNGKAYFVSQGEPINLWQWINKVLKYHDIPAVSKKVPYAVAYPLACAIETFCNILPFNLEPPLSKFLVSEMATDHYFDISRAKELLGYQPKYTVQEALEKSFGKSVGFFTEICG